MENTSSFDSRDGSMLFIGRIDNRPYPTGSGNNELKRSLVYSTSLYGANAILNNPTGYSGAAVMSIDGLLRPVSISGLDGLPRFGRYSATGLTGTRLSITKGGPVSSIPPILLNPQLVNNFLVSGTGQYQLEITQQYLNPLTNPLGLNLPFSERHEISGSGGKGHDIELVGHPTTGTGVGFSMVTSIGNGSGVESYSNDYKFIALKGPLVITQWGYDTNNKPIPNQADNYDNAIQGIYSSTNLQDYFLPNFLQKSETWPVGPLDLRWDRRRGVWTTPPPPMKLRGILKSHISASDLGAVNTQGSGIALIIGPRSKDTNYGTTFGYDKNGLAMTLNNNMYVTVYDETNNVHISGSQVSLRWDSVLERFMIEQDEAEEIIRFRLSPLSGTYTGYYNLGSVACTGGFNTPRLAIQRQSQLLGDDSYTNIEGFVNFTSWDNPRPFTTAVSTHLKGTATIGGYQTIGQKTYPYLNIISVDRQTSASISPARYGVAAITHQVAITATGFSDPSSAREWSHGYIEPHESSYLSSDGTKPTTIAIFGANKFFNTGVYNSGNGFNYPSRNYPLCHVVHYPEAYTSANYYVHSGYPTYMAIAPVSVGITNGVGTGNNGYSYLTPPYSLYGLSVTNANRLVLNLTTQTVNFSGTYGHGFPAYGANKYNEVSTLLGSVPSPRLSFDANSFSIDSVGESLQVYSNLKAGILTYPSEYYTGQTIPPLSSTDMMLKASIHTMYGNRGINIDSISGLAYFSTSASRCLAGSNYKTVPVVTGITVVTDGGGFVTSVTPLTANFSYYQSEGLIGSF